MQGNNYVVTQQTRHYITVTEALRDLRGRSFCPKAARDRYKKTRLDSLRRVECD